MYYDFAGLAYMRNIIDELKFIHDSLQKARPAAALGGDTNDGILRTDGPIDV
jgi:hypothetical protein